MRLFLAIDLPSAQKKLLSEQLEFLKKEYANFSWVSEENYHITLQFFGEVGNVDSIKKRIEDALFDAEYFNLYSWGADLFLGQKIVLYVSFRREKRQRY